jgi:hypothetical protein
MADAITTGDLNFTNSPPPKLKFLASSKNACLPENYPKPNMFSRNRPFDFIYGNERKHIHITEIF